MAGLGQAELAAQLGIERSRLSAWELGRNEIGSTWIARIASLLRVSTDELLGVGTRVYDREALEELARLQPNPERRSTVVFAEGADTVRELARLVVRAIRLAPTEGRFCHAKEAEIEWQPWVVRAGYAIPASKEWLPIRARTPRPNTCI